MKILSLSGENLASLTGQFTIDFSRGALGAAGLFAITGNTRADGGKSMRDIGLPWMEA
ncbi:exonuclease SbcC [Aeromonas intestinalis]